MPRGALIPVGILDAGLGLGPPHRLGAGDRELVAGRPRWNADVDVARRQLCETGLVTRGSREGQWRLTTAGTEQARQLSILKVPHPGQGNSVQAEGCSQPHSLLRTFHFKVKDEFGRENDRRRGRRWGPFW